jgi:hypothetical protein
MFGLVFRSPLIAQFVALVAMATGLAGCANPGKSYADRYPELPAAHREILARGKIPSGDAVAGLTREQVKLAMGGDPTTFDKIGNEDAWIYIRKKAVGVEEFEEFSRTGSSRMESTHSYTQSSDFAPRVDVELKTTVFFKGDRATRALNTGENR